MPQNHGFHRGAPNGVPRERLCLCLSRIPSKCVDRMLCVRGAFGSCWGVSNVAGGPTSVVLTGVRTAQKAEKRRVGTPWRRVHFPRNSVLQPKLRLPLDGIGRHRPTAPHLRTRSSRSPAWRFASTLRVPATPLDDKDPVLQIVVLPLPATNLFHNDGSDPREGSHSVYMIACSAALRVQVFHIQCRYPEAAGLLAPRGWALCVVSH